MSQWVVVETEWRKEPIAVHELQLQGFKVFWPYYLHTFTAHNYKNWSSRPRPAERRGLYQPWIFVRIDGDPEDDVSAIRYSEDVTDVLWSPRDPHYLPDHWITWITSNETRVDPMTGEIQRPPHCLNPTTGLFEQAVIDAGTVPWKIGERVKIGAGSPFNGHHAAVERIDGESVTVRTEQDVFGRRIPIRVDATQLERVLDI